MGAKSLNKAEFDKIKTVLDAGVTAKSTAAAVGRGIATVTRIKAAENYEGYRDFVRSVSVKKKPEKPVSSPVESSTKETTNQDTTAALNLLNDNLVLMAEKMEKFTQAVEKQTIATYALRKVEMGDKVTGKGWWK